MKQLIGATCRRRRFILAIIGSVPFCVGRPRWGKAAVDVGEAIERSQEGAAALLDEIVKEPLPLSDPVIQDVLDRDFRLRVALARELSEATRTELDPFILSEAAELVEMADEYEVPLVPAVDDIPRPELKPSFPLASERGTSSPVLADREAFADAMAEAVLVALGFKQEDIGKIKSAFRRAVDETPGANQKLDEMLEAAGLSDWWKFATAAAGLISLLLFGKEFIIAFARAAGRDLGDAAGKRFAQMIIKGATLRFIPFVGVAVTTYYLLLAAKLLIQRLR